MKAREVTLEVLERHRATGRAYDPRRLKRASLLHVEEGEEPGHYRVAGNVQPFYDVHLGGDVVCYCLDHEYRGVMCKHELAARLYGGDPSLILALGQMLQRAEARQKEARGR